MLKDGKLNAYWIHGQQQPPGGAEHATTRPMPGYRNPANFIVVSDAYPTVTAMAADLILPAAMWVEKEGAYGNAERRTHFWHQLVNAPGEARSDLWQLMEFSKRFTTDEVWPTEMLDAESGISGQDAVRRALRATATVDQVPGVGNRPGIREPRSQGLRLLRPERPVRGIRRLRARPRPRSGAVRHVPRGRAACAGRWSRARKRCWRYREGLDPYVKQGEGVQVLRQPGRQGRSSSPSPTSRRPRSRTRNSTCGWSPAGCWSTGIPAP